MSNQYFLTLTQHAKINTFHFLIRNIISYLNKKFFISRSRELKTEGSQFLFYFKAKPLCTLTYFGVDFLIREFSDRLSDQENKLTTNARLGRFRCALRVPYNVGGSRRYWGHAEFIQWRTSPEPKSTSRSVARTSLDDQTSVCDCPQLGSIETATFSRRRLSSPVSPFQSSPVLENSFWSPSSSGSNNYWCPLLKICYKWLINYLDAVKIWTYHQSRHADHLNPLFTRITIHQESTSIKFGSNCMKRVIMQIHCLPWSPVSQTQWSRSFCLSANFSQSFSSLLAIQEET